jgi:hypothetical protein
LPGEAKETHEYISVGIIGALAELQTKHLINARAPPHTTEMSEFMFNFLTNKYCCMSS